MEKEQLVELIKCVSTSGLTKFEYEDGNVKVKMEKEYNTVAVASPVPVQQVVATEAPIAATEEKKIEGKVVKSPLVGTFYSAPSEDADPYVSVGDSVKKGQTLAIVEAMKLMNEIESEFDGVIDEILVENGQSVEYGQPLFTLR